MWHLIVFIMLSKTLIYYFRYNSKESTNGLAPIYCRITVIGISFICFLFRYVPTAELIPVLLLQWKEELILNLRGQLYLIDNH